MKQTTPRSKAARRKANAARALSARIQRAARHDALMAHHAERKAERVAAYNAWQTAYDYWEATGKGPEPIHPDAVTGGVVPSDKYGDDDLLRAAAELGIDLSGVGA